MATKNLKDIDFVVGNSQVSGGFKSLNCNTQDIGDISDNVTRANQPTTKNYTDTAIASAVSNSVTGPSSSTDNTLSVYDGATGKLIKEPNADINCGNQKLTGGAAGTAPNDFAIVSQLSTSSGDVIGPSSSTDNTLSVYDGATGKLIKEPNADINCGNQKLTGGAAGTAPNDFAIVSQLSTSNGDVIGPSSSTDNTLSVYNGATGKLIKEPNADINCGNQKLTGGAAGTAPNDFATVSQLSGLGATVSSFLGYDVVSASDYLNPLNASSSVAPLNFATLLEAADPDAGANFVPYTGIETLAGDSTKTVLITSLVVAQSFNIGDIIYIRTTTSVGDSVFFAGSGNTVLDVLTSGSQIGIVIGNGANVVGTASGEFKKINSFQIDQTVTSNFDLSVEFLGPSNLTGNYLGVPDTYDSVINAPSGLQALITKGTGIQKDFSYFVKVVSGSGANYTGIWFAESTPDLNSITINTPYRGASGSGTYEYVLPTLVATCKTASKMMIDYGSLQDGVNVVGNRIITQRVYFAPSSSGFSLLDYPITTQKVYTDNDYNVSSHVFIDFAVGDRIMFAQSTTQPANGKVFKPYFRGFGVI